MISTKIYQYCYPKQAIFKQADNLYEIITEYGKQVALTLNETLVYLFSGEQNEARQILSLLNNHYPNAHILEGEVQLILKKLLQQKLLKFDYQLKKLHPHYLYNVTKIVNFLEMPVTKKTILSLSKLEMSVTHECPFNCSYCSKRHHLKNENITITKRKQLIEDAYNLGANTLALTGGEPLHDNVFEETMELIKFAKQLGYKRKVIFSNGFNVEKNYEIIAKAGVDEIQISYNKNYNFDEDKIRNQFIEQHIEALSNLRNYGIRVGVCSVLTKESSEKIKEIIEFCIVNKLNSVYFYPVMPVGNAEEVWNKVRLSVDELKIALKKIMKHKNKYKNKIYISCPQSFLNSDKLIPICEGGINTVYVTETGYVSACACSPVSKYNVNDHSLEWIWRYTDYFDEYRKLDKSDAACYNCRDSRYCINSCLVRKNFALNKGIKCQSSNCLIDVGTP